MMNITHKKTTMKFNATKGYRLIIGQKEIKKALVELTPNGFKLYMMFFTVGEGWVFKAENISRAVGMSIRTMQYAKRELIKKEYLFIDHEKRTDDYYIGPTRVIKFKKEYGIPLNEVAA